MSYAAQTALAKRLIGQKGRQLTVTRPNQGAFDEIAGTRAAGGAKTGIFKCVGFPPGKSAEREIGTLVNRKLQEFYLAWVSGTVTDLEPGDIIPWKGVDWPVIWSATYDPDGNGVIFTKAYAELG